MTEPGFRQAIEAAIRFHREAYATDEPSTTMQRFLDARAHRRATPDC